METLETIRRRIDNARDMQSVVGAMKVLAFVSIRQFGKSLASLNDYSRAIELGLQAVMANPPPDLDLDAIDMAPARKEAGHDDPAPSAGDVRPGEKKTRDEKQHGPSKAPRTCALIFGSEQGLSGQFNERIAAFALGQLEQLGIGRNERSLLTLGDHVSYRLTAGGEEVERQFEIHGSVKTMKNTVQQLFNYLGEIRGRGEGQRILLFHHKSFTGAHNEPTMTQLYPLDPGYLKELKVREWPARNRPVYVMNGKELLESLVRQHFRVTLESAFVESLVSENSSRLVAMQVAEQNITDYLEELQREFNEQRQSEITSEILDIVAGLEAVEKAEREERRREVRLSRGASPAA